MRVARDHNRRFLFGIMIPTVLLSVLLLSCRWDSTTGYDRGKTPLVKLNGNVLYAEDLLQVLPLGITGQDSVEFSEKYIRNWVEDVMFYQNAERNIPDTRDIDRLVDNYRRSLIGDSIEDALDELGNDYSEEEIRLVRIKFISEMAN